MAFLKNKTLEFNKFNLLFNNQFVLFILLPHKSLLRLAAGV